MLGGDAAIAALMCTSFFMSVMYPTLFDMGVKASGDRSHIGAAIMVMTIAGGALVPPLMGLIADRYGIRSGYLLMVLNFAVIAAVAYRNTTLRASVSSRMVS
jgi:FHS family L-fucose permease-like MFS transporter